MKCHVQLKSRQSFVLSTTFHSTRELYICIIKREKCKILIICFTQLVHLRRMQRLPFFLQSHECEFPKVQKYFYISNRNKLMETYVILKNMIQGSTIANETSEYCQKNAKTCIHNSLQWKNLGYNQPWVPLIEPERPC